MNTVPLFFNKIRDFQGTLDHSYACFYLVKVDSGAFFALKTSKFNYISQQPICM